MTQRGQAVNGSEFDDHGLLAAGKVAFDDLASGERSPSKPRPCLLHPPADPGNAVAERVGESVLESVLVEIIPRIKAAPGIAQQAFFSQGDDEVADVGVMMVAVVAPGLGGQAYRPPLSGPPKKLEDGAFGQVIILPRRVGKGMEFSIPPGDIPENNRQFG